MTRTADRPRSSRRGIGGFTGNVAPRGRHEAVRGGHLAGTGLMARLALRRSRWFWLLWILALWAIMPATVSAYATLIPDPQTGAATVEALAANPTMRAMLGPPFDLLHAGGFTMWRVGTFAAGAAAMMGALGVIRATRAEEEDGRIELLRSGAIGRHAPLAGALVVALGACVVLAALITASMTAGAPPFTGALATGLGIGLTSALGAGLGALTAQVTESARTARGLALATIGVAYLVRALADGSPSGSPLASLGWLSPLQWAALTRPDAGDITVDTDAGSTNYNSVLYGRTSCSNGQTEIDCSNETGTAMESITLPDLTASQSVFVFVDGSQSGGGGASGNYGIIVTP